MSIRPLALGEGDPEGVGVAPGTATAELRSFWVMAMATTMKAPRRRTIERITVAIQ
jgi:hypothetical protein